MQVLEQRIVSISAMMVWSSSACLLKLITMKMTGSRVIWMLLSCACAASNPSKSNQTSNAEHLFQQFIDTYQRSYQPGSAEYDTKFECFTQNIARYAIMTANSTTRRHGHTANFGINKLADRCFNPRGIHPSTLFAA
jgi:hypothetical protein